MATAHPGLGGIRLCFGGNVFGWTIDQDRSFAVLDAFYEGGIASGTSVQQVQQLCAAARLELTPDQIARLTRVSVDAET